MYTVRRNSKRINKNKKNKKHMKTARRRYTKQNKKTYRKIKGGSYETDVTTRMTDGVATKPLHTFVVTVPGYGTMSGTAYKRLMEEIDRDGPDAFYK